MIDDIKELIAKLKTKDLEIRFGHQEDEDYGVKYTLIDEGLILQIEKDFYIEPEQLNEHPAVWWILREIEKWN